jgi:hypothetical protein
MSNTNTQIAVVFPSVDYPYDPDHEEPLFSTQPNTLPAEFLLTTAAFIELLEVVLAEQYDDELSDAETEIPSDYNPNPDDI